MLNFYCAWQKFRPTHLPCWWLFAAFSDSCVQEWRMGYFKAVSEKKILDFIYDFMTFKKADI
jgi:hypothetical protein